MNSRHPITLTSLLAAFLAAGSLSAPAAAQRGRILDAGQLGVVIDHDPMRMSVGSPVPIVGSGPRPRGPSPSPPQNQVTPDPSLNQIVIERPTPISVYTGNSTKTGERLRLECYCSTGRRHGLIGLRRLTEGEHGDYTLAEPVVSIRQGEADFVIRFHRSVLGRQHTLGSRTVYLVTFKDTEKYHDDGDDCIQTITVLSDDPTAFGSAGSGSSDKK